MNESTTMVAQVDNDGIASREIHANLGQLGTEVRWRRPSRGTQKLAARSLGQCRLAQRGACLHRVGDELLVGVRMCSSFRRAAQGG